ncbi:MAG: TadE family type IV pilus minor pilin [Acidimicrobiia bacterium]|nr:TadE family type IV pilus minor pilin [Acidimicrobiia bacterium]
MVGGGGGQRPLERGQATVEFALVLPLLVLCVAALVWVGQVVTLQVRIEHAAREGARAAAVEPGSASSTAAQAVAVSMGSEASVSTSVGGEYVVVRVTTTANGVPLIGVGERVLVAEAHMRREDIND